MEKFEEWFDKFYESSEARDFCFGNHNNATRDEAVGEFSAKTAWKHQQAKIDKLEQENQILSVHVKWFDQVLSGGSHRLAGQIDKLEQEKKELVEALEYYQWTHPLELSYEDIEKLGEIPNIWASGKKARQVLAKIKREGRDEH